MMSLAGRIAFDGIDIREFQHQSLVQHLSIVQQDNFLFDDSVLANIRLWQTRRQ